MFRKDWLRLVVLSLVVILSLGQILPGFAQGTPDTADATTSIVDGQYHVFLPTISTSGTEPVKAASLVNGKIQIMSENFEGIFPSSGWGMYNNCIGGFQAAWGATDANAYTGQRSAWPARSGTYGVNPSPLTDPNYTYPPNMCSSMQYGPFSVGNGYIGAHVSFKYWTQMLVNLANLSWWVGCNNYPYDPSNSISWYRIGNATGDSPGWQSALINLASVPNGNGQFINLMTCSKLYIAFNFTSSARVTPVGHGAFVDDVEIWKVYSY